MMGMVTWLTQRMLHQQCSQVEWKVHMLNG
jgi:hypothetical protein